LSSESGCFAQKPKKMLFVKITYRNTVSVFLSNALGLSLALLEGVLVLEFAAHVDGVVVVEAVSVLSRVVKFKCRDDCLVQAAK
jgi:hypothetical protein